MPFYELTALVVLSAVVGSFGLLLRQPMIVSFISVSVFECKKPYREEKLEQQHVAKGEYDVILLGLGRYGLILLEALKQQRLNGDMAISTQQLYDQEILKEKGATLILLPFYDAAKQAVVRMKARQETNMPRDLAPREILDTAIEWRQPNDVCVWPSFASEKCAAIEIERMEGARRDGTTSSCGSEVLHRERIR